MLESWIILNSPQLDHALQFMYWTCTKHQTISATLRTIWELPGRKGEDNSVSPALFPPMQGVQKPIISSCREGGKQIFENGESQSGRNLDPSRLLLLLANPNTSTTPANEAAPIPSPSPFSRSICVILLLTTPAWSIIMHEVKRPKRIASTINPRIWTSWVGRSRHVIWRCRPVPWLFMHDTNRVTTRVNEYTQEMQV